MKQYILRIFFTTLILFCSFFQVKTKVYSETLKQQIVIPIEMQMHHALIKYAKEYCVPIEFAFAVAYEETRYTGYNHTTYNNKMISSAGAIGPMQIMLSTARGVWNNRKISKHMLYDIDFNIKTSMKYINSLYLIYYDWGYVFGHYNTGKKIKTKYSRKILNYKLIA